MYKSFFIYKMKRVVYFGLGCLLLLVLAAVGGGMSYLGFGLRGVEKGERLVIDKAAIEDVQINKDISTEYKVEEMATGLMVPESMIFTANNRLLIAQRNGQVLVLVDDKLDDMPLHEFNLSAVNEGGLLSMTKDPDYIQNQWLYFCVGDDQDGLLVNRIVRLRDNGSELVEEKVLLDGLPISQSSAGCQLHFGLDGKLYVSTSGVTNEWLAQDVNSMVGKILRLNKDGTVPDDNPFWGSHIWSLGHRNSQGFDWHPVTGDLWATDQGQLFFDEPVGGDELNLIVEGGNYGWPIISDEDELDDMFSPKLLFELAEEPASSVFYDGDKLVGFKNNYFIGVLRGEGLIRVVFDEVGQEILYFEKLKVDVGRVREVIQGPDDLMYFSTSNLDGYGDVRKGDDKILRLNLK